MGIVTLLKRKILIPALYGSGVPFRSMKHGNKNVIFNYHGVIPEPFPRINNRHMSASQFEEDLRFIKKRFEVVSLEEIFKNPAKKDAKSRPKAAITFDDGFENNLKYALPLLQKYHVPTTIFIISASIQEPDFVNWADLMDVYYVAAEEKDFKFMGEKFVRVPGGYVHAGNSSLTLFEFIKNLGMERIEPLRELAVKVLNHKVVKEKYRDHVQLMTPQQLLACEKSGLIEIASHSRYHFNLGRVPLELAAAELQSSRNALQELLQKDVWSIAYPDGDYSAQVKDIAEKAGYTRQLAVDFRLPEDPADQRIRHRFSYSNSTTHASNMVRLGFQWNQFSF